MATESKSQHMVKVLNDEFELTLGELCRACELSADRIVSLVEEGVVEPQGREPATWKFQGISIRRIRRAYRLQRDLGINLAGVALAIELMEEIDQLKSRLRRLDSDTI